MDVGVVGEIFGVVLVVGFCGIEGAELFDFGDNGAIVDVRGGNLRHIGIGDGLLFVGGDSAGSDRGRQKNKPSTVVRR